MGAATDLWDAASEYLEACKAALDATPYGAPPRSYVSPGVPAWDCVQVTVHVGGPTGGAMVADTSPISPSLAPGHRIVVSSEVDIVTLTATVVRCVPSMTEDADFPAASSLDSSSAETLSDLWAIWNYVKQQKRADALFPPRTREMVLDPAVTLPEMGGFGGWQIPIRVQLDGYA